MRAQIIGNGEYVNLVLTRNEFGALMLSHNVGWVPALGLLTPIGKAAHSRVRRGLREIEDELVEVVEREE